MGKIIGKGITFDDVLLVPQFSSVIPNDVVLSTQLTKENQVEYSSYECRYGHCHRAQNGNRHGQTGWNRSYS